MASYFADRHGLDYDDAVICLVDSLVKEAFQSRDRQAGRCRQRLVREQLKHCLAAQLPAVPEVSPPWQQKGT